MQVKPSPLEQWFTRHPSPYQHFLGGAAAAAWPGQALLTALGIRAPDHVDWDYATPQGDAELREAIADEERLSHRDHVLLSLGASEANFLALGSLLESGDEVILQMPIYPQFACLVEAAHARVVPWPMPQQVPEAVDTALLPSLMSARTRLVVINSPHNPTGRYLTRAHMLAVGDAVRAHPRAHLLVDEVYRNVGQWLDDSPGVLSQLGPERILISQSVSKSWALPGARLGWLAGDAAAIQAAVTWREHVGLALPSPATAWVKALWGHRKRIVAANHELLRSNRALVAQRLAQCPGIYWETTPATGVGLLGLAQGESATFAAARFALDAYQQERLFIVPGDLVGFPGRLRLGYGHRSPHQLTSALDQLVRLLERWQAEPVPSEHARLGAPHAP